MKNKLLHRKKIAQLFYLFTFLVLFVTAVKAQTYSTKTIDGVYTDWNANELVYTSGSSTVYASWDATYLYVRFSGGYANTDQLNVGIDTDPGTNNNGTSNTAAFSGVTFSGFLTPDYAVQTNSTTNLFFQPRSGTTWAAGTDLVASSNLFRTGSNAEMRILRSSVGLSTTTNAFGLYFWLSNSGGTSYTVFGGDNAVGGVQRTEVVWANSGAGVTVNTAMNFDYNSAETRTLGSTSTAPAIRNLYINNNTLTTPASALTLTGNCTIGAGGLTLGGVGASLSIGGNFVTNAAFTNNGRTVTMNGTIAQSIGGTTVPTFSALTITNSSANVTASSALTVTSALTINGSATLTRLDMGTNTLTLTGSTNSITSGFLRSRGTITGGTNTFGANGTFEHNYATGGAIPTAAWANGSTCAIIGATTALTINAASFSQSFWNFTWNCPSQTANINLGGLLTTVNGNFSVLSTGTAALIYATGGVASPGHFTPVLAIGGDFVMSANSFIANNGATSAPTFNIGGNLTMSGTTLSLNGSSGGSGTTTFNIAGNFTNSGTACNLNAAGVTSNTIVNISGNINLAAGSITKSVGPASINFIKPGLNSIQTFTQATGTLGNAFVMNVGNGTTTNTLQLLSNVNLGGSTPTFNVLNNAGVDFKTFSLSGNTSTFVALTGSTLTTAHLSGISIAGVASGSVRTSVRTFSNAGVNYVFNGAGAQSTGNAIGASTIGNLTTNNSAGVTISASTPVNVTGTLTVPSNNTLNVGANTLTVSAAGNNSVAGIIAGTGASALVKTGAGVLTLSAVSGNNTANTYATGTTINTADSGSINVTGLNNIASTSIARDAQSVVFSSATPTAGTYRLLPGALTVNTSSFTHNANESKIVTFSNANSTVTVEDATITTGNVSPTAYLVGTNVSVPFTTSGTLTGTYTAQLSDASGSFLSPVAIGTGTSSPILATIPGNTAAGTGYRIRVVSLTIPITGTANVSNITVATATTWTGSWDYGEPTAAVDAVIALNYVTGTNGAITAKSLTVNDTRTLTVNSTATVTVTGALVNNGGVTGGIVLENNANLIQTALANTNSGTGSVTVNRNGSTLKRLDYTLWSSPVASQNLLNFSPLTVTPRFYSYSEGSDKFSVVSNPSGTTFTPGGSFFIRMPDQYPANAGNGNAYYAGGATLSYPGVFTGTLNNGNIPFTLTKARNGYQAVGNPYPSVIDAQTFVSANTANIENTLYFWRKTNGTTVTSAYATWTAAGGTIPTAGTPSSDTPNGKIQVGQGFIVKARGAATVANFFTNAMRDAAPSSTQFFKVKQQAQKDRVWLNLTGANDVFSQALVAYIGDATLGLDQYDGKYINDSDIALTTSIAGDEYTIQGRPAFDNTDVLALNFKTSIAGTYTIAIDHVDGLFSKGQDIYLVDKTTGATTNLNEGAYTFTAAVGVDNTRFTLAYQKTLKVDAPVFNENSVLVSRNNGTLNVKSTTAAINNVKVYDIQGRLVAERKNVKSNTASFSNLKTNQVLIVKVTSDNNAVVTKKVLN